MTLISSVDVAGVGLFCPGHRSVGSWLDARGALAREMASSEERSAEAVGASSAAGAGPISADGPRETSLLSVRVHGRASRLTRIFASVIEQAVKRAQADVRRLPMIYGSAFGEMATTLRLLESMQGGDGRVSPVQFQASVHNTAAGLISISQGNRAFTTSIAAGHDTFAMCLLEAWSWLDMQGGQILIACADDAVPSIFEPMGGYSPFGVAFVLDASLRHPAPIARLGRPKASEERPAALKPRVGNPCGPGLALLAALYSVAPSRCLLNPSADLSWQVDVSPLACRASGCSNSETASDRS